MSLPKDMQLTPPGMSSSPMVKTYPRILGGTCEYCGTVDQNYPGEVQYKLCPHYKDMDMKCIFCPLTKDHSEIVRNSIMKVIEDPRNPGHLVTLCGSYECTQKFEKMFNIR